jgi:hypothetical protein
MFIEVREGLDRIKEKASTFLVKMKTYKGYGKLVTTLEKNGYFVGYNGLNEKRLSMYVNMNSKTYGMGPKACLITPVFCNKIIAIEDFIIIFRIINQYSKYEDALNDMERIGPKHAPFDYGPSCILVVCANQKEEDEMKLLLKTNNYDYFRSFGSIPTLWHMFHVNMNSRVYVHPHAGVGITPNLANAFIPFKDFMVIWRIIQKSKTVKNLSPN